MSDNVYWGPLRPREGETIRECRFRMEEPFRVEAARQREVNALRVAEMRRDFYLQRVKLCRSEKRRSYWRGMAMEANHFARGPKMRFRVPAIFQRELPNPSSGDNV